MGNSDNINAPVSPQEWYEAGVLLRREERFGDAVNAFRRAADLASSRLAAIDADCAPSDAAVSSSDSGFRSPGEISQEDESRSLSEVSEDDGSCTPCEISQEGSIRELEKIRAASLAFIEMINEIREFVNKDLLNP